MSMDCLGASLSAPSLDDVRANRGTVQSGMAGASVEYIQALTGAIVDGKFGPATEKKVREFQAARALPVTGTVEIATLAALDVLAGGATKGVSQLDLSASDAPTRPVASATAAKTTAQPQTNASQQPESSTRQYLAYGLAALAATGLGWALLKR